MEEDSIDKYNKLLNYVLVNVCSDGITSSNDEYSIEILKEKNSFLLTIPNTRGIDLPETGRNEAMIFNILGYIFLIFGCGYYIKIRKDNYEKNI